jgi:hypothetical protein
MPTRTPAEIIAVAVSGAWVHIAAVNKAGEVVYGDYKQNVVAVMMAPLKILWWASHEIICASHFATKRATCDVLTSFSPRKHLLAQWAFTCNTAALSLHPHWCVGVEWGTTITTDQCRLYTE